MTTSSKDRDAERLAESQEQDWAILEPAGVRLDEMRRMSLLELFELVIDQPRLFKVIWRELGRQPRQPDPAALDALVRAYQARRATAWLTASFLAHMHAAGGYEVGREILRSAASLNEASNATRAMVLHDPSAACADFLDILCDETAHPLARRCAALGLNQMNDPCIVPIVLEAVRVGRLGPVRGAAAIHAESLDANHLMAWLGESGSAVANLAFDVVRRRSVFDAPLARAVRAALDAGRIEATPTERECFERRMAHLEAW